MPQYLSPGVYVEEVESGSKPIEGVGTAVAAFVGLAQMGPVNQPTLVTNWTQFTGTFGAFMEGSYLAHSVYAYFQNGGGACYVVRIGGNGENGKPTARAALTSGTKQGLEAYRVSAIEAGAGGDDLSLEVRDVKENGDDDGGAGKAGTAFTLVVKKGGKQVETFENVTTDKRAKTAVVTTVNETSEFIRIEEIGKGSLTDLRPSAGTISLSGGTAVAPAPRLAPDDYVGDPSDRTGFGGLEAIEDVTMVCAPDVMAAYQQGGLDLDGVKAVQLGIIAHCELMGDRMAILDPPPGLNAQQVKEWRVDVAGYDSKFAALYWPWIKVFDPATGTNQFVPPSGAMAGIWGRSDDTRGVHKAPANEVVRGVLDLELNITKSEHDQLNPDGINCIRAFPGRGIRVWGARTLSSDPSWRYINVRRLFNYLEKSILGGTQWVVFEPNDMDLWGRIRRTINSFLTRTWRDGALFGAAPEEAFFVKCDAETNPPDVIDAGQVVCLIGVSPVKPAEFVVFKLSQFSAGNAVEE
ncbi:phage tail sheath family protein [Nitriliruptor alkaliphilus]|uniref:phage tail sheath family protein n=1 Tax=Nitriliruptor alkaliphilus TaxID=427918 RepID=UPI0006977D3B|nr:phage tail sheath subtilisin-like domain-containing protein [Nitriliruptor alkaliphilus]